MRALTIVDGHLEVAERADPAPGAGEVLVRVHGAGLNRADLAQRAGYYPAPPGSPADIPGLEFAGEIVTLGRGVTEPEVGSRVFGITGGGGQAELLTGAGGPVRARPRVARPRRRRRRARGVRHRARRDGHPGHGRDG